MARRATPPTVEFPARVEVIPSDINKGCPGVATSCPVARAFRRTTMLDATWEIMVGPGSMAINIKPGKEWLCCGERDFSPEVEAWIQRYDRDEEVRPVALVLKDDCYEIEEVA